MIYIGNPSMIFDWERAYSQLSQSYNDMVTDYEKAILKGQELRNQIDKIKQQNEALRRDRTQSSKISVRRSGSGSFCSIVDQSSGGAKNNRKKGRINKLSSTQYEPLGGQGGAFQCTYEDCDRVYNSTVSLNLHIKLKHNGGTKKGREAYAKILLQAEANGQQVPQLDINLPPNFIEVNVSQSSNFVQVMST